MIKAFFFTLCSFVSFLHAEESVIPASEAPPAAHPIPAPIPSYESTLLKMLLTLGGLLIVVIITVWVLKKFARGRFGSFGNQKKITILERKNLSPKTALYVLELEGKKVLLSESQLEVKMIPLSHESDLYE